MILYGKFGRPHPRHIVSRRWYPQQRSDMFARKSQSTKCLVVFHDHTMDFTMIFLQGIPDGNDHPGQTIVSDTIEPYIFIERESKRNRSNMDQNQIYQRESMKASHQSVCVIKQPTPQTQQNKKQSTYPYSH